MAPRADEDGDAYSRRSSYSGQYEPMPDCYYSVLIRLISISSGLARIGFAAWNIHLQIESIRVKNYYADMKFTLFWGDALVILSSPIALKAGIWVNRITLQAHAVLSMIAIVGPILQVTMSGISIQLDGKGINPNPEVVYSYKSGSYSQVYAGNNADPMIAIMITVISSFQIFILFVAICIHGKSLKKKEEGRRSRVRSNFRESSRQSSPERPFDCYLSREQERSYTTPQISDWMESPRQHRAHDDYPLQTRDSPEYGGTTGDDPEFRESRSLHYPPPAYDMVVAKA